MTNEKIKHDLDQSFKGVVYILSLYSMIELEKKDAV